jgi:transcriptional regulator with XRE-family HTH domain
LLKFGHLTLQLLVNGCGLKNEYSQQLKTSQQVRTMEIQELLDKAKKRAGLNSDYALAQSLGFTKQAISKWRNDLGAPDAEGALKLAGLAGIEPVAALAVCELAKTRDPDKTAFWKTIAAGGVWRKR